MRFRVELCNVQHIKQLTLEVNLAQNKLTCLVGRNGVGKTTLVRALRNLSQSDTFLNTARAEIFEPSSVIRYCLDGKLVTFNYDQQIKTLNCKTDIPREFRSLCTAELPIPDGTRFNFFQSVSRADREIRRQITLGEYDHPAELVDFLGSIYSSDKFESLIEIRSGLQSYFCILQENGKYIREDYLSSGEYFLINLYKMIKGPARLIAVDELDISLDAAAQVHLVRQLRKFCTNYNCNILFTTHSLAMMRTLENTELFYMGRSNGTVTFDPVSYSYVKSRLFGFTGWDRYILTEDDVLAGFLTVLIDRCCENVFFDFKIIYIGGGSQVVDLLERNRTEKFFAEPEAVVAVLDGDQQQKKIARQSGVWCLPFKSVESALKDYYEEGGFPYRLAEGKGYNGAKDLFKSLQRDRVASRSDIFGAIIGSNRTRLSPLVRNLQNFLSED